MLLSDSLVSSGDSVNLVNKRSKIDKEEFDPGSGRTLAACLTHASRTDSILRMRVSGARVSNT